MADRRRATAGSSTPGPRSGSTTSAAGPTPGSPGRGRVLNVAVDPAVEVADRSSSQTPAGPGPGSSIQAANYDQTIRVDPAGPRPEPHGLLQFAVAVLPPGPDLALEIPLHSLVPAGISTGTSAAVYVALLGALNALQPQPLAWPDLARLAHRVETEKLGQQSGIQDQIAAAHGGSASSR